MEQIEHVVPVQAARKKLERLSTNALVLRPFEKVLGIVYERSHAAGGDVEQQVVRVVGIGRSHVALLAAIDHLDADARGCLPK